MVSCYRAGSRLQWLFRAWICDVANERKARVWCRCCCSTPSLFKTKRGMISSSMISCRCLRLAVRRWPLPKSVLLFDACESGSLIGDRIAMRGIEEKTVIDRMTGAMVRTVLTATTDSKPAIEGLSWP